MIAIEGLEIERDGRRILSLPEWRLDPGAHAALVGPSGSGKTTLLNAIGGLTRPTRGRVTIDGRDLAAMGEAERDRYRGAHIGIVFQTLRLVRALTVSQNLALALHLARRKPDPKRIADTLERLGIARHAHSRPQRLSVGEMQRAAIARAVAPGPRLILADEPTSALDDANAAAAIALLKSEAEAVGASLIVATHDRRISAAFSRTLTLEIQP